MKVLSYFLQSSPAGLHLLEIVGYLLLISTVAVIATPNLAAVRDIGKLRNESRAIVSFLKQELLLASQVERTITINITPQELSSWDGSTQLRSHTLPQEIAFSRDSQIAAYPRGVVSPKTLILENSKAQCIIKISLRSRIRSSCE